MFRVFLGHPRPFAPLSERNASQNTLEDAILHNDLDAVQDRLRADNLDINAFGPAGETLLMIAARKGHLPIVRALLAAGADPNLACQLTGHTALMMAAQNNYVEVMQALIEAGAKLDAQEAQLKMTALMWAARDGHLQAVQLLIRAGAKLNEHDLSGFTALHWITIADRNRVETARLLLQAGADIDATDNNNKTPLMEAVIRSRPELVKTFLAAGADVNQADNKGRSALMHCADCSPEVVNLIIIFLLLAKADLTAKDKENKTAAEIAQSSRNSTAAYALSIGLPCTQEAILALKNELSQEHRLLQELAQPQAPAAGGAGGASQGAAGPSFSWVAAEDNKEVIEPSGP